MPAAKKPAAKPAAKAPAKAAPKEEPKVEAPAAPEPEDTRSARDKALGRP
jgi:hypothetical protein